ncbi:MAG: diguanylate cyclase [Gammaproteobacteria bacterium]|nr:diguanylate cyclase [Gammaproteobacteria bacterium]
MGNEAPVQRETVKSPNWAVVLLVDDQAMVAEGIRRMLEHEPGIEFHYCSDPKTAINMAVEVKATTVLQDLVMPDIDGMTLVRFYRANPMTRDIPIVVLSSKDDPKIKSDAFANGATDYLVKLPEPIELIARIRAHSKSYLAQRERDEAYHALREMQEQLREMNAQLAQSNRELHRLSSLDGLTGIANRRQFDDVLEREWQRSVRNDTPLSLILLDIDYFKPFNDRYGHQAGDDCLRMVARTLDRVVQRPTDLVARYGGEEFVVVLPDTNQAGAEAVARELLKEVRDLRITHEASKVTDHLTLSIGTTTRDSGQPESAADLVAAADQALYLAKEQGRNRVETTIMPTDKPQARTAT